MSPLVCVDFLPHALDRAQQRFPGMTEDDLRQEVLDAIDQRRFSAVRPAWLLPAPHADSLYAWTPDHTRTFAISGGETAWHVKTIIRS